MRLFSMTFRWKAAVSSVPLVKASSVERMKENMDIFDFEISAEDISILEYMPQDMWQKEHPDFAIPKAKSNFEQ